MYHQCKLEGVCNNNENKIVKLSPAIQQAISPVRVALSNTLKELASMEHLICEF